MNKENLIGPEGPYQCYYYCNGFLLLCWYQNMIPLFSMHVQLQTNATKGNPAISTGCMTAYTPCWSLQWVMCLILQVYCIWSKQSKCLNMEVDSPERNKALLIFVPGFLNTKINTLLTSLLLKICGIHLFFIQCAATWDKNTYCILQVHVLL